MIMSEENCRNLESNYEFELMEEFNEEITGIGKERIFFANDGMWKRRFALVYEK